MANTSRKSTGNNLISRIIERPSDGQLHMLPYWRNVVYNRLVSISQTWSAQRYGQAGRLFAMTVITNRLIMGPHRKP
eukprot:5379850-Amphidinium_carterae.2